MSVRLGALVAVACACGGTTEVTRAKRSLYDAEFAVVYSAALDATRELYPNLDDHPGPGAIATAWKEVPYANTQDDLSGQAAGGAPLARNAGAAQTGAPARPAYKRHFIRFDIVVTGGRPWRVKVAGHASEWEPGAALPTELRGAARPPWLDGRTDALTLAIYRRIKRFAVPMPEPANGEQPERPPPPDPTVFANVPAAAATRLAQLKDAVARRDYAALRQHVFDDVAWSRGGEPGAETAIATWQADPAMLDAMARALAAGCASTGAKVACPAGEPVVGQWQLVLELRVANGIGAWKVAAFVPGE